MDKARLADELPASVCAGGPPAAAGGVATHAPPLHPAGVLSASHRARGIAIKRTTQCDIPIVFNYIDE